MLRPKIGDSVDPQTVVELRSGAKIPEYPSVGTVGPYDVLGRLARGGMAEVFLARESTADGPRHLVLKFIAPERRNDESFAGLFEKEAEIGRQLFHPNICHVYEYGNHQGNPFMSLEYVHGVSLLTVLRRIQKFGGLPPRLAAYVCAEIADALDYVHNARGVMGKPLGIVHRDVSPHNIMVGWNGSAKLLDFGIARAMASQANEHGGKRGYASPEQIRMEPVDPRSDVFSLGIVLCELLTGKRLYEEENVVELAAAITIGPVPNPTDVDPDIPARISSIVRVALAKNAEDRFFTAGEMAFALRQYLEATGEPTDGRDLALFLSVMFEDPSMRAPLSGRTDRHKERFESIKKRQTFDGVSVSSSDPEPIEIPADSIAPLPGEPTRADPSFQLQHLSPAGAELPTPARASATTLSLKPGEGGRLFPPPVPPDPAAEEARSLVRFLMIIAATVVLLCVLGYFILE